jgi:uncharacterized protein (TIGR02145 family)
MKIMRTKFFFFAMFASVMASAQVTYVEPVGANYTSKTVSFRVWWNAGSRDATHLSKVWLWVDYITVNTNNTTSGNSWTRALVSGTPTTTAGTVARETGNDKGFWLTGNASTSYSATVTVRLDVTASQFNWCAYVSDYPPNVSFNNVTYTFKGTPPFTLLASNGALQTLTGTTLTASALTVTPATIRDNTECPGVFCPYNGSDRYIDATHLCQQRTSGVKNWEAWIKDTRDNELYRIVLMPDNKWWLAQNLKYTANGTIGKLYQSCGKDSCGRFYTCTQAFKGNYATNQQHLCPSGWILPSKTQWDAMANAISTTLTTAWRDLRSLQWFCSPKTNRYGWAASGRSCTPEYVYDAESWHSCNGTAHVYVCLDNTGSEYYSCDYTTYWNDVSCVNNLSNAIRCMRL